MLLYSVFIAGIMLTLMASYPKKAGSIINNLPTA